MRRAGRFRRCSCETFQQIVECVHWQELLVTKQSDAANRFRFLRGCDQVPLPRTAMMIVPTLSPVARWGSANSGQPRTPSSTWPSLTSASATAYCSRRKKPLVPSIGSSVQNVLRRFAAAAIDQAAYFFRRGVGNRRLARTRDLIERRDAFFKPQRFGLLFANEGRARQLLSEPPGDERLHRKIGHRHRRTVVLGERAGHHFALNTAGQQRRLANGSDGKLELRASRAWPRYGTVQALPKSPAIGL